MLIEDENGNLKTVKKNKKSKNNSKEVQAILYGFITVIVLCLGLIGGAILEKYFFMDKKSDVLNNAIEEGYDIEKIEKIMEQWDY